MTALELDPPELDAAVITLLQGPGNVGVHEGFVADSDALAKTISAPLPYVLFNSALPFDPIGRLGGDSLSTETFTLTHVNDSEAGAKALTIAVRGLVDGHQLSLEDGHTKRVLLSSDDRRAPVAIARDQLWSRPGGLPLFFAVDRYYVR